MLQPDLIHKLNLIADEGWEYHKLPLEKLDYVGNGPPGEAWDADNYALTFQGQPQLLWGETELGQQGQASLLTL
jgi:hypothetical protein